MNKLIGILLFLTCTLSSAQLKKWTLEECVLYAVENNLSIAQMELQLNNVKIGESDARGAFLPNLNSSSNANWSSGLVLDPTSNSNTAVTGTIFSMSGGISSNVTLFNGLRNIHQFNRAKLNTIASQYQLDDMKEDIMLAVANSFLQVLSNKEALKVVLIQAAITQEDLQRTKELVEAGVVAKGDLLEIEATVATQEQQIVSAENMVYISKISLAQLLQITDYENFQVADDDYQVPLTNILNNTPKDIFAKALDIRSDIKLSETNVEVAKKDLSIAKGARYPSLGFNFNYNTSYTNRLRFDQNAGEFFRDPFVDQLWMNDGISYGLGINIPIFNGNSVRNNIIRSQINIDIANLQLEQDKMTLEANINQAYVDVSSFGKAYEAAQKTLDARRLAYEYAKERFNVGLMNAFDFNQSQARVDNAEVDVIRAKYDYIFRIKILEIFFGIPVTLN